MCMPGLGDGLVVGKLQQVLHEDAHAMSRVSFTVHRVICEHSFAYLLCGKMAHELRITDCIFWLHFNITPACSVPLTSCCFCQTKVRLSMWTVPITDAGTKPRAHPIVRLPSSRMSTARAPQEMLVKGTARGSDAASPMIFHVFQLLTSICIHRCNGKNSCVVSVSNSVFGDPCVGTFKYLEVAYTCLCK